MSYYYFPIFALPIKQKRDYTCSSHVAVAAWWFESKKDICPETQSKGLLEELFLLSSAG